MELVDWVELILLLVILTVVTKPLGIYLHRVLNPDSSTFLDPIFKPLEKLIYKLCKLEPHHEQNWSEYLFSILGFSFVTGLFTFLILRFQGLLFLNPEKFPNLSTHLSFNTAVSFLTNTNWQSYSPESSVSYFSQMVGLTLHNFLSPMVGLSVAAAFVRALARSASTTLGNFWVDLVRLGLYLFLPFAIIFAIVFVAEGVPQNFQKYAHAKTVEGDVQVISQGPIASQEAIKLLGTNGGGITHANSAHPYENPTPLTNFIQILLILLIPAAQTYYFGREVKSQKHGWSIYAVMSVIFISSALVCSHFELAGNPIINKLGVEDSSGNMEGKEQRFGSFDSALFIAATTCASNGATNSSIGSYTPVGGATALLNIQLGEIIFGGVGSGLYGMIIFILIAVFIAGLVVGKGPEYLGKKIEGFEIKMVMISLLIVFVSILGFTAISTLSSTARSNVGNAGPHGFTEILYAYSSATGNNGSSFSGLSTNNPWYNYTLAFAMLLGRFLFMVPVMAIAGSLVQKKKLLQEQHTLFPVSGLTFMYLLIGVILLINALTFIPSLTVGPILEQFFMNKGTVF